MTELRTDGFRSPSRLASMRSPGVASEINAWVAERIEARKTQGVKPLRREFKKKQAA